MKTMVKVMVVKPDEDPEIVEVENTLGSFQSLVGGYIECVDVVPGKLVLICDENGRIEGKEPSVFDIACDDFICGTAVFAGVHDDDFADIPEEYTDFENIPRVLMATWVD